MGGRFFWSSLSDVIGRKATYATFFLLGAVLYALVPPTGRAGNVALFVLGYVVIISMYGGGFATIPAYLRDMFGTIQVGAIHGRLLTAWSTAGVLGPVLVNYIREYEIAHGVPKADAYTTTMYIMAGAARRRIRLQPARAAGGRAARDRRIRRGHHRRGLRGEPKCQANQTAIKARREPPSSSSGRGRSSASRSRGACGR